MSTRKSRYFEKGNKYRYTTERQASLTGIVTLRVSPEKKKALKNVPNWQERLRGCIDSMIVELDGE